MATTMPCMTTEELLDLPADGIERTLRLGELREAPMTTRGGPHCIVTASFSRHLLNWLDTQTGVRGRVYAGDARVRLRRNPDTFVGIDLVYLSPDHAARTPYRARFIDGPPLLAIEILSPTDTQEAITEKIGDFLDAGVALIWVVEPVFQTITVYRPDAAVELITNAQTSTAEPHLPGFALNAAALFAV